MEKAILKSQYGDYIKLVKIDSDESVHVIYEFYKNKPTKVKWLDAETEEFVDANVIWNGDLLKCDDGHLKWDSDVDELLTETE